jgi:hypothetical protein
MDIQTIAGWIVNHPQQIALGYAVAVTVSSYIVKFCPVLQADHWLLPAIKFIGKYLAVNTNVADNERPIV